MTDSNDKPSYITLGMNDALGIIKRVEQAFADRGMAINTSSALGALFSKVHRLADDTRKPLSDTKWRAAFRKANEAVRIARAVEAALDDDNAKEAIHRVRISNMDLTGNHISRGKDALWELDLHRWFKQGGVPIRFEEPDLVVSLGEPFGDYAIACKKVNSENNVADSFSDACRQIAGSGRPGIVALNLDDVTPADEGITDLSESDQGDSALTEQRLEAQHNEMNRKFVIDNAVHFRAALERGDCDGVLVARALITDTCDTKLRTRLNRTSAVWNHGTGPQAKARFEAFCECLASARRRLEKSGALATS